MAELNQKALKEIDILAEFCAKSEQNLELIQMVTRFMYVAQIPGAAAVLRKRVDEEKKHKG